AASGAPAAINPTRARDYVAKTSGFFSGVGVANLADGYQLNGSPNPAHPGGRSSALFGPPGVRAMGDAAYQRFPAAPYAALAARQLLVGGQYYDESWMMLSLLMMTGNFLDYTAIQPVTQ